ncbi:MAG: SlyX protein [Gammaproteobacteria bacterium]|nr:MAG: SlyX protein [Gammaproteobacteria bacterium]
MDKLEKIQEKIAFQEHTIEQLNDALAGQQQQLTRLSEELRLAMQLIQQWRCENQRDGNDSKPSDEIPPHY